MRKPIILITGISGEIGHGHVVHMPEDKKHSYASFLKRLRRRLRKW